VLKTGKWKIGNIYLVGFMGAGKSTVAEKLAKKLNWKPMDTDTVIEKKAGKNIYKIFQDHGEPFFRKLEQKVLNEISKSRNQVIALGGGTLMNNKNFKKAVKTGILVYLKAHATTLATRTWGSSTRPLMVKKSKSSHLKFIRETLKKRSSIYGKSSLIIRTDSLNPSQTVSEIEKSIL
jgi:shikimate kinase